MDDLLQVSLFQQIDRRVDAVCLNAGYRPSGPLAERHGTWQHLFQKASGSLRRAIILGMTPDPESSEGIRVTLEVAADDGSAFVRRSVKEARDAHGIPRDLDEAVTTTISMAELLTTADLTERYLASITEAPKGIGRPIMKSAARGVELLAPRTGIKDDVWPTR